LPSAEAYTCAARWCRGREARTLQGLRKRISSLFLAFIETPEFNPESSRFQIVPVDFQENYVYERVERSMARPTVLSAARVV
jgi:hypothetical protein